MRVCMIGGTGFLGYFTADALRRRGHEVVAVGLEPPAAGTMPDGVAVAVLDADHAPIAELRELIAGSDVVIHAAGADGRHMFDAPAIDGFRRANVDPVRRLVPLMRELGVPKLVIFGSYYTALDRLFPALGIAERNAYPRSRREQADVAMALGGGDVSVGVLELPYIFGAAPGRGTLWGFYVEHVRRHDTVVPVPAGGTACVTARQVAAAAVGACERLDGHRHWPIGGRNLSYAALHGLFARALGLTREFAVRPAADAMAEARAQQRRLGEAGKETGYDPVELVSLQAAALHLDPAPAMEALGYVDDDLERAVHDAVHATLDRGGVGPAGRATLPRPTRGATLTERA